MALLDKSFTLNKMKGNTALLGIALGIISLIGLYLGYPSIMLHEKLPSFNENCMSLNDCLHVAYNTSSNSTSYSHGTVPVPIKWGFISVTPSACLESNAYDLSGGIYLSVCNYTGNVIVDIRKFTGNSKIGITPTSVGIGLNVNQWNLLKSQTISIVETISELS